MCGISGIINPNGFDLTSIIDMTDIIRHRGPDDEGFLVFNDLNAQPDCLGGKDTPSEAYKSNFDYKPVQSIEKRGLEKVQFALGHRRLSILDLSPAGHQPLSYLEGRYWIVLNGEIYNYIEIRQELIDLGHRFVSNTDTEVVLAAYHEWGTDCQHRFNGMWAFVIYDANNQEIFMSRDRFGIKPLYYWFAPDGCFCFASEIKQFTVLPGWQARINPQRAYDYLIYSFTDHTDETMFDSIYQICNGEYFLKGINDIEPDKKGKIQAVRWYDLPSERFKGTFEEASQIFNERFRSAVELHLRADVPVGSALSGGLDSSAIVCEVNNLLKKQGAEHLQKTFSSCSVDPRFDEKKWMDIVIDHTKVDAHFVYPKLEDVFRLTPDLIWYHDEPYQSQSAFLSYHVFESAKQNDVKVLLNGQGADEYLGGYGQLTAGRLLMKFKRFQWSNLINEIKKSGQFKKYTYSSVLNLILPLMLFTPIRTFLSNRMGYYVPIKKIIDTDKLGASNINPNKSIPLNLKDVGEITKHFTFFSTLPKYLKWEDRNSMANSVEARVPFLDHRLVEFGFSLPADFLDFQGETKRVMRKSLINILPNKISNRKDKEGFITPEERWVKEDNPEIFRNKVIEAIKISHGVIKPEALLYYDRMISGKIPFNYTYWRLILFSEWIKRFNLNLK